MRKLIVGTLLIAILMSGCSNTMADIYDNESKITSDTNSFNLNGIKQEINGNSYNATVEKIYYDDFIDKLALAKQKLTPAQRNIFEMSREEGMSNAEIAALSDISEQTVKNHLSAALKSLREELRKYNYLFVLFIQKIRKRLRFSDDFPIFFRYSIWVKIYFHAEENKFSLA